MLSPAIAEHLKAVISRAVGTDSVAGFRNEFKSVVDRAKRESAGEAEIEALLQLRAVVERWIFDSPPARVALDDWLGLLGRRDHLSEVALQAAFARFPVEGANELDWAPLLLNKLDRWVAREVIRRGFVKADILRRIPETDGEALYGSPLLDEILESGVSFYPSLLKEHLQHDRPNGLLAPEVVAVRAFASDGRRNAPDEFVKVVAAVHTRRVAALEELLRHPPHAMRLTGHLVMRLGGRPARTGSAEEVVLHGLITAARTHGDRLGAASAAGHSVLGVLRCSGLITDAQAPDLSEGLRAGALATLRAAEAGASGRTETNSWLPLSAMELYEVLQDYLRHLPAGSSSGQESPERRIIAERYAAKVEVLNGVIEALETAGHADSLREELEIALFNLGVRPLGEVGEIVSYDPDVHSAPAGDAMRNDLVRIASPGWIFGDGDHRRIMRKAIAERADD
jgi:hypothetical protein